MVRVIGTESLCNEPQRLENEPQHLESPQPAPVARLAARARTARVLASPCFPDPASPFQSARIPAFRQAVPGGLKGRAAVDPSRAKQAPQAGGRGAQRVPERSSAARAFEVRTPSQTLTRVFVPYTAYLDRFGMAEYRVCGPLYDTLGSTAHHRAVVPVNSYEGVIELFTRY